MSRRKTSPARSLVVLAGLILLALYAQLASDAARTAPRAPDEAGVASVTSGQASSPAPAPATTAPAAAPVTVSDGAGLEAQLHADLAADPVAQQVPMLFQVRREMQLETLRWLLHVPEDKVAAAVPSVRDQPGLSPGVRRDKARAIIADLITALERDGVHAPTFSDDFVAARLVGVAPATP
jgi:hypothetical protein